MNDYFKRPTDFDHMEMPYNNNYYSNTQCIPLPSYQKKQRKQKRSVSRVILISSGLAVYVFTVLIGFFIFIAAGAGIVEGIEEDDFEYANVQEANSALELADYLHEHLDQGELTIPIKTRSLDSDTIEEVIFNTTDFYYCDVNNENFETFPEYMESDDNYEYYSVEFKPNIYYYVKQSILNGADIPEDQTEAKKLAKKCKTIMNKLDLDSGSRKEKVRRIHDYIIKNTKYVNTQKVRCHTAEGCLLDGEAVCQGYSYAMKLLCDLADVPCRTVTGDMVGAETDDKSGHEWNLIKIKGSWRQMDVTWDDNDDGNLDYTYFLIKDKEMAKNHIWEKEYYPETASK